MHNDLIHENVGALEMGVLIPTCDIKVELAKMSPEDAHLAKRKWRKLMRRAKKSLGNVKMTKNVQRYHTRRHLRLIGRQILNS